RVGLMGHIARATLAAGGEVTGVIPRGLVDREVGYTELTDLRVVESMHERKALMIDLSDGFIALPGGLGTIEEFFEALTWGQLGLHQKPCGLLNVSGYFDHLVAFLDTVRSEQFVDDEHRAMLIMEQNPERLLDRFAAYRHPSGDKAAWTLRLSQDFESG
ncbi:MAG TPA: TIGR00730 family Rossman fold protein, partial [Levilinea sp.]|nr:TIGR00730 family Rossman fold protein [Levilinea sp.]